MDVGAWLSGLGLRQYEQAFRDNAVDAAVLPELTGDDLKDLGVRSVGHRRKLLAAIAALRSDTVPIFNTPVAASNVERRIESHWEASEIASEMKSFAKREPRSSYAFDRRA